MIPTQKELLNMNLISTRSFALSVHQLTKLFLPLNTALIKVSMLAVLIAGMSIISGCTGTDDDFKTAAESEKEFYDAAQDMMRAQQWELAIANLQALEENFPFGNFAEQAQLDLIYSYYRNYDFDLCTSSADRFIRLHPRHRQVDYAYYMKGLASFTSGDGMFERFLPTDISQRDPGAARESFTHFNQLLTLFPDSQYAPDAEKRMIYLRNLLARAEIHAANYYFKRGAYIAAVNRGRYVTENFQHTPAVPDALAVIVQAYHLLDLQDLADNTLVILRNNYPEHPALTANGDFDYQYNSGEGERSWVSKLTFGLFDKVEPPGFDTREIYNAEYSE